MPKLTPDLKVLLQYALPHRAISRLTFYLARMRSPLVAPAIRWFVARYQVDLSEAEFPDPVAYLTFNDFFTRALKPDARPVVSQNDAIASPADGRISAIGHIDETHIFQAKGHGYSLEDLLAGEDCAMPYRNGLFATIYLSPRDYHRVHMPRDGKLTHMTYVPGRLFSVAPFTVENIPGLFARNERVIAHFETDCGPMALVLVGAINVAAIETSWAGLITPPHRNKVAHTHYSSADGKSINLRRGQEMGRFNLGSTVILLFSQGAASWDTQLAPTMPVRMGQQLGRCRH